MARKIKVNFTGVESYVRCEEGQHVARLKSLEEKVSQNGSDMLVAKFEVIQGNSTGAVIYHNFVLTEKALWNLKGYLEVIGLKSDGKIILDLDKLVGKVCIINVLHEEYKNQLRAKIDGFKALEADEEDDEEEEKPAKKKKTTKKAKKKPEPVEEEEEEEEEEDDDDDDWEEE